MAAPVARGPLAFLLQSQTGQWMTISLGALYAFPEQTKMFVGDFAGPLAKSLTGFNINNFVDLGSSGEEKTNQHQVATTPQYQAPAPIIIHTTTGENSGSKLNPYVGVLIKVVIGGTACWLGYFALTNALPEYMQEFFPVTRKFFAKTSKFLVAAIEHVKEALEEQIGTVSKKQDDLSDQLDTTHESVLGLHQELGEARTDLHELTTSMARQESTVAASYRTQSYTSRGVTLLVRCVATMLPHTDRTVNDLAEYIKDGEEIRKHEETKRLSANISKAVLKNPISNLLSPPPKPSAPLPPPPKPIQNNLLIRESRADSDMDSLEDVHAVLGLPSGGGNLGGFFSSTRPMISPMK